MDKYIVALVDSDGNVDSESQPLAEVEIYDHIGAQLDLLEEGWAIVVTRARK